MLARCTKRRSSNWAMAEPEKRHAMQTPEGQLDPEAVTLMGRVCSEAWSEVLEVTLFITPQLEREARRRMSDAVISAVIADAISNISGASRPLPLGGVGMEIRKPRRCEQRRGS
jgi:hypothetical protein